MEEALQRIFNHKACLTESQMNHYDYCPDCHSESRVQSVATKEIECLDCRYVEGADSIYVATLIKQS